MLEDVDIYQSFVSSEIVISIEMKAIDKIIE